MSTNALAQFLSGQSGASIGGAQSQGGNGSPGASTDAPDGLFAALLSDQASGVTPSVLPGQTPQQTVFPQTILQGQTLLPGQEGATAAGSTDSTATSLAALAAAGSGAAAPAGETIDPLIGLPAEGAENAPTIPTSIIGPDGQPIPLPTGPTTTATERAAVLGAEIDAQSGATNNGQPSQGSPLTSSEVPQLAAGPTPNTQGAVDTGQTPAAAPAPTGQPQSQITQGDAAPNNQSHGSPENSNSGQAATASAPPSQPTIISAATPSSQPTVASAAAPTEQSAALPPDASATAPATPQAAAVSGIQAPSAPSGSQPSTPVQPAAVPATEIPQLQPQIVSAAGGNRVSAAAPGVTEGDNATNGQPSAEASASAQANGTANSGVKPAVNVQNLALVAQAVAAEPNAANVNVALSSASDPTGETATAIDSLMARGEASTIRGVTTETANLAGSDKAAPQVASAITKAIQNGDTRFMIRLDPPQLGKVDVQLDVLSDGRVHATLSAERGDTLDVLQKDARLLERAFQDAGLKPDQLNFQLRQEDKRGPFGFDGDGQAGKGDGDETAGDAIEEQMPPGIISDRAVDIRV